MKNPAIVIAIAVAAVGLGWLMMSPDDADAPASAPLPNGAMVVVNVPELSGSAVLGQQVFEAKCAACHGANAAGRDGAGPPLIHKIYEPSHHGDGSFLLAAQRGVQAHHWRFGNMPPVDGITTAEVAAVVDYVRQLQRANGIN